MRNHVKYICTEIALPSFCLTGTIRNYLAFIGLYEIFQILTVMARRRSIFWDGHCVW
jgi:hypothetical protein